MITIDSAGRYQVTVTNEHGCEAITSVKIESPTLPDLGLNTPNTITCIDTFSTIRLATNSLEEDLYTASWVNEDGDTLQEDSSPLIVTHSGWFTLKIAHQPTGCIEKSSVFVSKE